MLEYSDSASLQQYTLRGLQSLAPGIPTKSFEAESAICNVCVMERSSRILLAAASVLLLFHSLARCSQQKNEMAPLSSPKLARTSELAKTDTATETELEEFDVPLGPVQFPLSLPPYCTTGRLNLTEHGHSCTAFMITESHALTAGHCVRRDPKTRPWALAETGPLEKLDLCLFQSCEDKGWCLRASKVRLARDADYALITYREKNACQYSLRYFTDESWGSAAVELIGYPNHPPSSRAPPSEASSRGDGVSGSAGSSCKYGKMFHSVCPASWRNAANELLYGCESLPGMSGAPVTRPWLSHAFGVHTGGGPEGGGAVGGKGRGVPMTKARYCRIARWVREDGFKDFGRKDCRGS